MANAIASASFFSGIRNNGETVVIKFGANKNTTVSNGFVRPLDVARWKRANESVPEYLRLLLALKAQPTPTTELAFKGESKTHIDGIKAASTANLLPEGPVGEQDPATLQEAIDEAYEIEADAKHNYAVAKAQRAGLVAYAKRSKAVKAPSKADLRKELTEQIRKGDATFTAEQLMAAGFVGKAK